MDCQRLFFPLFALAQGLRCGCQAGCARARVARGSPGVRLGLPRDLALVWCVDQKRRAVHEYTHSFLHAKVALVDDEWSTVGSSNLDPLSLMMAREANIVTRSKDLAQELKAHLQEAIATGSAEVHRTDIEGRSRYNRARDMMAYGSVLLALKLARMHY